MRISLRAGEKLYLNGAVVSVDRKVSLELLNDATFLIEAHVLQAADAKSPLRQIYFAVQLMLMDPANAAPVRAAAERMFEDFIAATDGLAIAIGVAAARESLRAGRLVDTLKSLRTLFPLEAALTAPDRTQKLQASG